MKPSRASAYRRRRQQKERSFAVDPKKGVCSQNHSKSKVVTWSSKEMDSIPMCDEEVSRRGFQNIGSCKAPRNIGENPGLHHTREVIFSRCRRAFKRTKRKRISPFTAGSNIPRHLEIETKQVTSCTEADQDCNRKTKSRGRTKRTVGTCAQALQEGFAAMTRMNIVGVKPESP